MLRTFIILALIGHPFLQGEKASISDLQIQLKEASQDKKSEITIQLAKAYVQDQNLEMAFLAYLDALKNAPKLPTPTISQEEQAHYDAGLEVYLDHNGGSNAQEIAKKILETYKPVLAQHPDNHLLPFLVAAAYANEGSYQEFMETFYKAYQRFPDHYMAYKTKAVLHIKLAERMRSPLEREQQRHSVVLEAEKAIERNEKDAGLYKLVMLFASDDQKPRLVTHYLNKIIEHPMIIARSDVAFFVRQAVEVKNYELAQRFIDKAQERFDYSRVVLAAQQYLDKANKTHE